MQLLNQTLVLACLRGPAGSQEGWPAPLALGPLQGQDEEDTLGGSGGSAGPVP